MIFSFNNLKFCAFIQKMLLSSFLVTALTWLLQRSRTQTVTHRKIQFKQHFQTAASVKLKSQTFICD